jgi:hypothetical protein
MYKDKICTFIDILGFSSLITKTEKDPDLLNKILESLDLISNCRDLLNESNLTQVVRPVLEKNAGTAIHNTIPLKSSQFVKSTSFSDSLVLSSEVSIKGWLNHILALILLTHRLLDLGILIRGGTTIGKLYQKGNIVLGTALVDSYKIESEISNYPRILISNKALENLKTIEEEEKSLSNFYSQDKDGVYFLDFLEEACLRIACLNDKKQDWFDNESNKQYAERIEITAINLKTILENNQTEFYKVSMKMRWLAKYFNKSLATKEFYLVENLKEPNVKI